MLLPRNHFSFPAADPSVLCTGRWTRSSTGNISTSWAGASLTIAFRGPYLLVRGGPLTERKDAFNGGAPMLAWCISDEGIVRRTSDVRTADLQPGEILRLFSAPDNSNDSSVCHRLELMVADWASVVELSEFVVESESCLESQHNDLAWHPTREILFIGDSITCGYSAGAEEGFEPLPHGAYDAYPSVFQRMIWTYEHMPIETIAYPGVTLVNGWQNGADEAKTVGMEAKFWEASYWSSEPWYPEDSSLGRRYIWPRIIVIALGANDDEEDIPTGRFIQAMQDFVLELIRQCGRDLQHIVVLSPFYSLPDVQGKAPFEPDLRIALEELPNAPSNPDVRIHHVDTFGWLTSELAPDGLHPNIRGHQVIAEKLVEWVTSNIYGGT